MKRDDIICMAKEATNKNVLFEFSPQDIKVFERFAKLVAAAEREACAALCFQIWNKWMDEKDTTPFPDAEDCAAAIRARGQV
jgi:hypothetical protein